MYIKSMSPSTIHKLVYIEGRVWMLRPSAHQSPPLPTVLERWGTMGAMGGIMGQTSVQQYTRKLLTWSNDDTKTTSIYKHSY